MSSTKIIPTTTRQNINYINYGVSLKNDYRDINLTEIFYNIDSNQRQKCDSYITKGQIALNKLSMTFTTSPIINNIYYNLLTFNVANSLTTSNKIIPQNINPDPIAIKTKWFNSSNISSDLFTFTIGYSYVVFYCNFNSSYSSSYNPYFIFNNIKFSDLQSYDTTHMLITISNYSDSSNKFIGNVPINWLNSSHQIYFTNPDSTSSFEINAPNSDGIVSTLNGFYIKLDQPFSGVYSLADTYITMNFNYIGGILLSELSKPLSIYSSTKNSFSVIVSRQPYYNIPFLNKSHMYVDLIDNIIAGCPNSNNFIINASFNNVVSLEVYNNTLPLFDYTIDNVINTFYWQNINDDVIYSVKLPYGKYNAQNLILKLENLINNTLYQNTLYSYPFLNKNYMKISIDDQQNITFKNYLPSNIKQPIQSISPSPPPTGVGFSTYILTILHYNHNLIVGDSVLFDNFVADLGISEQYLNGVHTITSIISINTYTITLSNVTLIDNRVATFGGENTFVYIPLKTRFFFESRHSIYRQLGFRGQQNRADMITNYNTVITNNDLYANELVPPDTIIHHTPLKLNIIDYYLIKLNNFNNIFYNSETYFCKINNQSYYNTFIPIKYSPHTAFDINFFHVELFNQNNEPADIDNLEYSLLIKITLLDYVPNNTYINQKLDVR